MEEHTEGLACLRIEDSVSSQGNPHVEWSNSHSCQSWSTWITPQWSLVYIRSLRHFRTRFVDCGHCAAFILQVPCPLRPQMTGASSLSLHFGLSFWLVHIHWWRSKYSAPHSHVSADAARLSHDHVNTTILLERWLMSRVFLGLGSLWSTHPRE